MNTSYRSYGNFEPKQECLMPMPGPAPEPATDLTAQPIPDEHTRPSDEINNSNKKQKMTSEADKEDNLEGIIVDNIDNKGFVVNDLENITPVSEILLKDKKDTLISSLFNSMIQGKTQKSMSLIPKCKGLLNTICYYDSSLNPVSANFPGAFSYTPLLMDGSSNIAITELLIANGADVNFGVQRKNHLYLTPIYHAIIQNNLPRIDLLVKYKADIHRLNHLGQSYLQVAMLSEAPQATLDKLCAIGLNKQLSQELLARCELAQIWGITGTSNFVDEIGRPQVLQLAGGLITSQASRLISNYIHKFFESNILTTKQAKALKFIKKAFVLNETPQQIVKKVKKNIPCVILGGYSGHTIVMTIYAGHLAISDRIVRNLGEKSTTDFYNLPVECCTEAVIARLQHLHQDHKAFHQMIESLNIQSLPTNKNYMQKFLNAPNCAWANSKSAVNALFIMKLGTSGRKLYKKFSEFTRINSLETYTNCRNTPEDPLAQQDADLIASVRVKQNYRANGTRQPKNE